MRTRVCVSVCECASAHQHELKTLPHYSLDMTPKTSQLRVQIRSCCKLIWNSIKMQRLISWDSWAKHARWLKARPWVYVLSIPLGELKVKFNTLQHGGIECKWPLHGRCGLAADQAVPFESQMEWERRTFLRLWKVSPPAFRDLLAKFTSEGHWEFLRAEMEKPCRRCYWSKMLRGQFALCASIKRRLWKHTKRNLCRSVKKMLSLKLKTRTKLNMRSGKKRARFDSHLRIFVSKYRR